MKYFKTYGENLTVIEGKYPSTLPMVHVPTHISTPINAHWNLPEDAVYTLTGYEGKRVDGKEHLILP